MSVCRWPDVSKILLNIILYWYFIKYTASLLLHLGELAWVSSVHFQIYSSGCLKITPETEVTLWIRDNRFPHSLRWNRCHQFSPQPNTKAISPLRDFPSSSSSFSQGWFLINYHLIKLAGGSQTTLAHKWLVHLCISDIPAFISKRAELSFSPNDYGPFPFCCLWNNSP